MLSDHAVHNAVKRLEASGFTRLSERDAWDLKPNGRYFATRWACITPASATEGQS